MPSGMVGLLSASRGGVTYGTLAPAGRHAVKGFGDGGVRHAQMLGDLAQAVPVRHRLQDRLDA